MNLKFYEVETAIKKNFSSLKNSTEDTVKENESLILSTTIIYFIDTAEVKELSTQFLQEQKNQLIDLQNHFERLSNTLPVIGLNSAKYDINLIKWYLLPFLVNEQQIEPTVTKANQFVSFKFGVVQLLDFMNFLGGAFSLDWFLKAYKIEETKKFSPYECFDNPKKLKNKQLLPYDSFFSKLRLNNLLEKNYNDFENLNTSGLSTEQAVCKLRLKKLSPTSVENYAYFWSIWVSERMKSFRDFLMWCNNKDVVPTPVAMQKMNDCYHEKEIDMSKLGCILPNLTKIDRLKVLPFYWKLQRLGEDSWRFGWWSLHCLKTQSCGWRNYYPQINEFVQVNFRHRR